MQKCVESCSVCRIDCAILPWSGSQSSVGGSWLRRVRPFGRTGLYCSCAAAYLSGCWGRHNKGLQALKPGAFSLERPGWRAASRAASAVAPNRPRCHALRVDSELGGCLWSGLVLLLRCVAGAAPGPGRHGRRRHGGPWTTGRPGVAEHVPKPWGQPGAARAEGRMAQVSGSGLGK